MASTTLASCSFSAPALFSIARSLLNALASVLRAARGLIRRERRRAPRRAVGSTVNVACPGAPETNAVLSDLSEGGTLIQTASRLPADHKIYFEFALPGQPQPVRVSGEVACRTPAGAPGSASSMCPRLRAVSCRPGCNETLQSSATECRKNPPAAAATPLPTTTRSGLTEKNPPVPANVAEILVLPAKSARNFTALAPLCPTTAACPISARAVATWKCHSRSKGVKRGDSGPHRWRKIQDDRSSVEHPPRFWHGVRFVLRDSGEREEVMRLVAVLSASSSLDQPMR